MSYYEERARRVKVQMRRINSLTEMLEEITEEYINIDDNKKVWEENKPNWCSDNYYKTMPVPPTHTEIKRLMMIIRQETIKLEKLFLL